MSDTSTDKSLIHHERFEKEYWAITAMPADKVLFILVCAVVTIPLMIIIQFTWFKIGWMGVILHLLFAPPASFARHGMKYNPWEFIAINVRDAYEKLIGSQAVLAPADKNDNSQRQVANVQPKPLYIPWDQDLLYGNEVIPVLNTRRPLMSCTTVFVRVRPYTAKGSMRADERLRFERALYDLLVALKYEGVVRTSLITASAPFDNRMNRDAFGSDGYRLTSNPDRTQFREFVQDQQWTLSQRPALEQYLAITLPAGGLWTEDASMFTRLFGGRNDALLKITAQKFMKSRLHQTLTAAQTAVDRIGYIGDLPDAATMYAHWRRTSDPTTSDEILRLLDAEFDLKDPTKSELLRMGPWNELLELRRNAIRTGNAWHTFLIAEPPDGDFAIGYYDDAYNLMNPFGHISWTTDSRLLGKFVQERGAKFVSSTADEAMKRFDGYNPHYEDAHASAQEAYGNIARSRIIPVQRTLLRLTTTEGLNRALWVTKQIQSELTSRHDVPCWAPFGRGEMYRLWLRSLGMVDLVV